MNEFEIGAYLNTDGLDDSNENQWNGLLDTPVALELSEGTYFCENDEVRVEQVSEIMTTVFTEDVVANWENMNVEQRTGKLNEYYADLGKKLDINAKGVYVDDLQSTYGNGTMGVNAGDGYLGIDVSLVEGSSNFEALLDTVTHEARHQIQSDAIKTPENFSDMSVDLLNTWEENLNNYVDPNYDYEGYWNQAVEVDARDFASEVVEKYIQDVEI